MEKRPLLKPAGLPDLLSLYLLAVLLFAGSSMAGDPGLGWHLRTGQWIWEHRSVPVKDPFLFTSGDTIWIYNQWLADVVLWLIYSWGGFPLLHAAAAGLCVAVYGVVLAPFAQRFAGSQLILFLSLFLAALLGKIQWLIRPVIFSFLFAALVWRMIYSAGAAGKRPDKMLFLVFPLLFALWANIHPAFGVGLVMVGCACAPPALLWIAGRDGRSSTAALQFAALLLLCTMATLLNPYGVQLHRGISSLLRNPYFMTLNREWLAPDFRHPAFLPLLGSLVVLALILVRGGHRRLSAFELIAGCIFCYLSLRQRRYIPFFSIVLLPALVKAAPVLALEHPPKLLRLIARADAQISSAAQHASVFRYSVMFLFIIAGCALGFGDIPLRPAGSSSFPPYYPKEAAAVLAADEPQGSGHVFNHPDWGGYLIWVLYPARRVFIDDRNDISPPKRYEEYFHAAAGLEWRETLLRYDAEYVLIHRTAPLAAILRTDVGWETLFYALEPEGAALFKRRPLLQAR